jgi:hypothetical protein
VRQPRMSWRLQPHEGRNGGFHPGQFGAVTSRAWRNAMGRIAFGHERAPTREQGRAHLGNRLRHWRRAQGCEVVRHLLEIRVGKIFEEIVHRRVAATPVSERHQLVHQIAGRFAGEARKVVVFCPLTLPAVASRAGKEARLHRVGCAFRRLRWRDGGKTEHQRHKRDRRANPPHAAGERAARIVRPLTIIARSQRPVSPSCR